MIQETYITTKGMTLNQAIHRIIRKQLKGRTADFGSAFALSGNSPSIRVLELI